MKTSFLIYIKHILTIALVMFLSVYSLTAQVVADSVQTKPKKLSEVFEKEFATITPDSTTATPDSIVAKPDSTATKPDSLTSQLFYDDLLPQYELSDTLRAFNEDSLAAVYAAKLVDETRFDDYFTKFNPSPAKAVWLAALFPGAGQIYNRKYWKLPIVYGGFIALLYGYNFNQRYFRTYQNAYRDMVTNSPNASYLQFLPGRDIEAKKEFASRNYDFLKKTFSSKKDTYRNWRDYCILGMVGVYLVSIVDAYVDAALYHFDISPELDAYNSPSMMVSYKLDF